MSNSPRPCSFCGNQTHHYFPNVDVSLATDVSVLGLHGAAHQVGRFLQFTVLACTNCGLTQYFMTNPAQVAQWVKGSRVINAGPG